MTGGPIVRFGTKCPSITSRCRTVPPPSRAASASAPSCAKLAERIEGASSINVALPLFDYTRKGRHSALNVGPSGRPSDRAAPSAAFTGEFEHAHNVEGVLRRDRRRGRPEQDIPNVRVVAAIIARNRRDAVLRGSAVRIHDREDPGVFFLLRFAGLLVPGNAAGAQFGLLHVKSA